MVVDQGVAMPDQPTPTTRRVLLPSTHSDLRATWHSEADVLVLTLWSGDRCTGSAPLEPQQAAELLAFLARSLAERAAGTT